jgi:hypothetical protein
MSSICASIYLEAQISQKTHDMRAESFLCPLDIQHTQRQNSTEKCRNSRLRGTVSQIASRLVLLFIGGRAATQIADLV